MTPTDPVLLVYLLGIFLAMVGIGGLLEHVYGDRPPPRWYRRIFG